MGVDFDFAQVHDRIYSKFCRGISQIIHWKGGVRIPRRTGIDGILHLFRTKILQFELRISGDFLEKSLYAFNSGNTKFIVCFINFAQVL